MKKFIGIVLALGAAVPAMAQTSVGVSIGINQPGVYGRINIGNAPPPPVVGQPVVIAPSAVATYQRPIYLYVPVEHQRHWARYCARYGACGQPVYFVQEAWVREHYRRDHEEHAHRGHDDHEDRGHRDHGRHGHDRDD